MSNKSKWIKAIGVAVTVIGVGVNLITDWVNEQKMALSVGDSICLLQKKKRKSLVRTPPLHLCLSGQVLH